MAPRATTASFSTAAARGASQLRWAARGGVMQRLAALASGKGGLLAAGGGGERAGSVPRSHLAPAASPAQRRQRLERVVCVPLQEHLHIPPQLAWAAAHAAQAAAHQRQLQPHLKRQPKRDAQQHVVRQVHKARRHRGGAAGVGGGCTPLARALLQGTAAEMSSPIAWKLSRNARGSSSAARVRLGATTHSAEVGTRLNATNTS